MDFDSLCSKLDRANKIEPSVGITQAFTDAWQEALGMTFTEMSNAPTIFEGLIFIAESPEHPEARRRVSADILREIAFTHSSESPERKRVCSALQIWGETSKWSKRAAAHQAFLMV